MNRDNRELINEKMANSYILERQHYRYFFFQVKEEEFMHLSSLTMELKIRSGQASVILNGYLNHSSEYRLGDGIQMVDFGPEAVEKGENILAYKGQVEVLAVYVRTENDQQRTRPCHLDQNDPYANALEFLLHSKITGPSGSQFAGSQYCMYDYTNGCFRMPCWLWSDAPAVTVLLHTIRSGKYPMYHKEMEALAKGICQVFLDTQILDPEEETYGAYVSRYRYYGWSDASFHCLLGPNDTSFSIKWAILPMYEFTGEEQYIESARLGLQWVESVIRSHEFVPSHYYFETKSWEDRAFVDTGFCAEGFQAYDELTGSDQYSQLIHVTMMRYLEQFQLDNGYLGQNYIPGKGADNTLFARGQAWALEGLLACVREGYQKEYYLGKAIDLADLIIVCQNASGSFHWSFGNGSPDPNVQQGTGECEKGTAILAYLLLELYQLTGISKYRDSAKQAVAWCTGHIMTEETQGYGGIASESSSSGITGLPFLKVATGYANAFYLMALEML